jgi:hypothetical protein
MKYDQNRKCRVPASEKAIILQMFFLECLVKKEYSEMLYNWQYPASCYDIFVTNILKTR